MDGQAATSELFRLCRLSSPRCPKLRHVAIPPRLPDDHRRVDITSGEQPCGPYVVAKVRLSLIAMGQLVGVSLELVGGSENITSGMRLVFLINRPPSGKHCSGHILLAVNKIECPVSHFFRLRNVPVQCGVSQIVYLLWDLGDHRRVYGPGQMQFTVVASLPNSTARALLSDNSMFRRRHGDPNLVAPHPSVDAILIQASLCRRYGKATNGA